ncbi:MAG TPA: transporter substrate-binding domain-containing protein [Rhizobiaceae bacterium]|nr:transporter substrate-binding domain-containing protein [Rhizobiaceae bacterium]
MALSRLLIVALTLLAGALPLFAAEPAIPYFWDSKERLPKPELSDIQRVRFLTTVDFPPFNFLDRTGRLTGFHIDLARALCEELAISDRCQIQALPWNELEPAMGRGEGEAIIAGLSISEAARAQYAFSRPYLQFPARFITPKATALTEPLAAKLKDQRVGVIDGSAHESMLREYFPEVNVVVYTRQDWMMTDMKDRKLAAVFGDGMRLGFWLAGSEAGDCCRFSGGPYLAPEYLGAGLAIAAGKSNAVLAPAFDYALQQLNAKGIFAELYLRYFPVSFY